VPALANIPALQLAEVEQVASSDSRSSKD
jgi:predicted protein tyrosine phosphatase